MTFPIRSAVLASLLCGAAYAPAAVAQEAQPGADDAGCAELQQLVTEQEGRIQQDWLDQAGTVAGAGDDRVCDAWVVEAQGVIDQGDAAEMIEGRIVVRQPDPDVTVRQAAPQVAVTQPEPDVQVRQAQPEIIVRQAPPTVRIEMPEPTVTIEQPEPEIIVNMPEPEVAVSQAEPQVQVSQAQPEVNVEQGEAEVDVQLEEAQGVDSADVEVQQGQPVVELRDGEGEAEVAIDQAQPTVRYEAAEPIVEIEGGGEPQVRFSQSGDANVQLEDEETAAAAGEADDAELRAQQAADPAAAPEATGGMTAQQDDADWRGGRTALTAPEVEREGYARVAPDAISVDELQGANVYGPDDNNIATISDVVVSQDGEAQHFLMDVGGFLGIGARTVAVGFDEATVLQEEGGGVYRVHVGATREQLEEMPAADVAQ